ncbi:MAG TPA: hypothetical protein VJM48_00280 [Methylibium sp.]|nr:hypothetical protein [Methylibium sp.]
MSPTYPLPTLAPHEAARWPRRLAARLLHSAGHSLERAAAALLVRPTALHAPRREFGADGAVYEDGRLVGFLDGVQRL